MRFGEYRGERERLIKGEKEKLIERHTEEDVR